jgi:hypothetical protein
MSSSLPSVTGSSTSSLVRVLSLIGKMSHFRLFDARLTGTSIHNDGPIFRVDSDKIR